jgi:hypothetical protein
VALRWLYEQGVSIAVKSFNEARMKQNLQIFDWELSEEDLEKINSMPQVKVNTGKNLFLPMVLTSPSKNYGMERSDSYCIATLTIIRNACNKSIYEEVLICNQSCNCNFDHKKKNKQKNFSVVSLRKKKFQLHSPPNYR